MLPKTHRLRLKKDFDRIFKRGKFISHKFFTAGFAANDLPVSRMTVVVAKKVSKSAVIRNSVKRKATEVLRLNLVKIKTGFDMVFLVMPEIKGKNYWEIEKAIIDILKTAKLIPFTVNGIEP